MASERGFSWRRCAAWAVTLTLHVAVLVAMTRPLALHDPPRLVTDERDAAVIPVDLAAPAMGSTPPLPSGDVAGLRAASIEGRRPSSRPAVEPPSPRRDRRSPRVDNASADDDVVAPPPAAPVARPVAYLDDEARARLPHEDLYSAGPPARPGGFYTPGDGSEDDVFYRPRALVPEPSRFASAWRPSGSLIDEWLGRLVEKATGTVSVPLNAKFSLVCGTVAGVAGSCTIVRNGGTGVIVERPPPAPWERSNRVQCRELRAALAQADEAAQVAYVLDRLSALCRPTEGTEDDEARREAGLQEHASTSGEADAPEDAPISASDTP